MRIKKVGANATCPCGSGRKHKRCCSARGLPWFETSDGHFLPHGIGRDGDALGLPPHVRDNFIAQAADLGKLDNLAPDETLVSLFDRFDGPTLAAVMASVGMPGALLLITERMGDVPPALVYDYWKLTGCLVTRRALTADEQKAWRNALKEVIDIYGVRELVKTNDGLVSCTFGVAPFLIDIPGLGLVTAQVRNNSDLPAHAPDFLWPDTEASVAAAITIHED